MRWAAVLVLAACAEPIAGSPRDATAADARDNAELEHDHAMPEGDASDEAIIGDAHRPNDAADSASTEDEDDAPAAPLPAVTFREVLPTSLDKSSPAFRYASMTSEACAKAVAKRDLPAARAKNAAPGIGRAMRITGPMNGVRLAVPTQKFGMLDCRLVLALDDLTKLLAARGVVAVEVDNFYRVNAKIAGRKKKSQHAFGLAADITSFELASGERLTTKDWGAVIGEVPCGPDAVMAAPTAASIEVRNLVCEVARSGIFNTLLSPSFNADHQSHFHFDLKKDSTTLTVR
ncbi:MAG: extensin family protein [Polyangiaceae bacterium]